MARTYLGGFVLFAALAFASAASAQTYPSGPVSIVIPLAAGTGMDTMVRVYADQLQTTLGVPVIVRNEPGASFMLASSTVAKAPADGLTLLATVSSTMVVNQTLFKSIPYNPSRDFVPIAYYVKSPFVLVVGGDSPFRTAADFVKGAKERQTPVTYASLGPGTSQNLAMELLKLKYNLTMTEVPYRATPQQVTDIAAGNVDIGFVESAASQGLIRDGKLRALAVSSSTRFALYPEVATLAEALDAPGFEAVSWHMLLAPSATPKPVVDRLHEEMKRITSKTEFKARATNLGLLPIETPSISEIKGFLSAEEEKWGTLLKKIGLAGSQ